MHRLFLEHTAIIEALKCVLAEKVFTRIWETNVTVGRIKVTFCYVHLLFHLRLFQDVC